MAAEPGLNQALQHLIHTQRTATLGTLDATGEVSLSRVPFAVDTKGGGMVIHISALAAHTANLQRHPRASLLMGAPEVADSPVHALPRVSFDVRAESFSDDARRQQAKACYLNRFPEAEPMTQLGDFRFVWLRPLAARHVAGFGAARSLDAQAIAMMLGEAVR